jgi:hypothetical protein
MHASFNATCRLVSLTFRDVMVQIIRVVDDASACMVYATVFKRKDRGLEAMFVSCPHCKMIISKFRSPALVH